LTGTSGIAAAVFLSDKHRDSDEDRTSRTLLEMAGLKTRRLTERVEIVLASD
jgi:hypothetical protein